MSGSWPKIIRDPVHDIIPFETMHATDSRQNMTVSEVLR